MGNRKGKAMMNSTSHLNVQMLASVFDRAFSDSVTQADKDSARHLRNLLLESRTVYDSVLFDIMEHTRRHDRTGLAEMAFLVGMQAGYELGIEFPPPIKNQA